MSDHDVLDWRDGWLCARSEYRCLAEPVLIVSWYQITQCSERHARDGFCGELGSELDYYCGGEYRMRGARSSKHYRLLEGGKTMSLAQERRSIPCPKMRKGTETRYYCGSWQKFLAREGWVAIGAEGVVNA